MPEDIPDDAKIERALKDADRLITHLVERLTQWVSIDYKVVGDVRNDITEALTILRKRAKS
jgi:hypothetical protein